MTSTAASQDQVHDTPSSSSARDVGSHASLLLFFIGAFAWSWTFNVLKILDQRDAWSTPIPHLALDVVAGLGPMLAALVMVSIESGAVGRGVLWKRLTRWQVDRRWYFVAVVGPLALGSAAYAGWVLSGGFPPPGEALAQWTLLPVFFVYILLVGGGVDEELGWRGYALPRLQERYSALTSSVILGVAWAAWHIPAWFTPGSGQDAISFPVFVVSVIAASIVFTWLFNGSGGSLPVVVLAHTIFDLITTGPWSRALYALPLEQRGFDPFTLVTAAVVVAAIVLVWRTELGRTHEARGT